MTNVANSIRAVATGLLVGVCWAALFGYIGRTLRATYPDEMHDPLWWEAIATISKALQYVVPGVVTGYFSRSKPMAMGALVCFLLAVMLNTYGGTTYLAMEWSAAVAHSEDASTIMA